MTPTLTQGRFRWLVTAWLVMIALGLIVSFAAQFALPPSLRAYRDAEWEADLNTRDLFVLIMGIPLLIAFLVSIIGLYRFWPSARPLTFLVLAGGLILQAVAGPVVDAGPAISLNQLAAVLNGVILSLVYLSPAKLWFENRNTPCRADE